MFSVFTFRVLRPPSCKHETWQLRIQGAAKDWRQNSFHESCKNSDQFNENLSWETIFLAIPVKVAFDSCFSTLSQMWVYCRKQWGYFLKCILYLYLMSNLFYTTQNS